MANISTIKPEIDTSAVFNSLNEMSTRIPQSSAQLGDALYNVFSSVSVNSEDALKLVETFAKGAVGAQTDAQTFGTAAMGVMNAYGIAASDAGHITDVFFNTIASGVVTGQELASSLGPVTQSAKAAGVSLDEMGAMITGVTLEGGPAAQNINNLNNFLQKVTTKEAQANLKALGLATTDATGSFRPQIDVLRDLKERLSGMSESARAMALQKIFPDAQARQGAVTLMDQLDKVDEALATNRSATGSTAAAYEKMSATFNSQSKLLMNTLMSILTTVGAALLPVITPLVTAFAQALPGAFQATQAALAPLAASIANLWASFSNSGALQVVIDGFNTIKQVFAGDWSPDASINPIVNALGILATFIRDNVMPAVAALASWTMEQFGTIVSWVQANWPLIQQTIATIIGNIQAMWEAHGEQVMTVIQAAWTIISTTISTALQVVLGLIRAGMQMINGDWSGAWETLKTVLSTAWEGIKTVVSAAGTALWAIVDGMTGGLLTRIQTWLTQTATEIQVKWDYYKVLISSAFDAIIAVVAQQLEAVKVKFDYYWELIKSVFTGLGPAMGAAAAAVGRAIIDGIASAITAGAGAIRSAAAGAAQSALDAAKSALGIESPSKVFRDQVGKMIPAGMIEGIKALESPLGAAMSGLVQPPRGLAALAGAGAGSSGGGGGGTHVHFHGDVYGYEDFKAKVNGAVTSSARSGSLFK